MTRPSFRTVCLGLLTGLVLSACATPAFRDVQHRIDIIAADVQAAPERWMGSEVVWGGRILAVENLADRTEVEVIAYPLDRDQQPVPAAPTVGRFIMVLPGFVEPNDYPPGRHLSVHGMVTGVRNGEVGEAPYVFPTLSAREVTVWPWGFMLDKRPSIHIGIGARIR